jgi:hypothetical protein
MPFERWWKAFSMKFMAGFGFSPLLRPTTAIIGMVLTHEEWISDL